LQFIKIKQLGLLLKSGYDIICLKNHSLRIGGATEFANDPFGGDFVAVCAGLRTSDCKFRYFHVIRERLEEATQAIGRSLGAFASYCHGWLTVPPWLLKLLKATISSPKCGPRKKGKKRVA